MKILIIDDEKGISRFIKEGLESQMFTVDVAHDGERGAFLGRTGEYDLVILDYVLPKLTGPEVLKEIRKEKKHMPVIMITVKSEMADKDEMFKLGVDDYLTKPFLFDELLLRVKALLRRPAKLERGLMKVDNLTLNLETRVVRREGKELYLTRKEFALLEYLMRNKGKIKSRTELLEHVWDFNADPFSNSVEVHIASLRRKLNQNKNRNLIHTFAGRGYKLNLNKFE